MPSTILHRTINEEKVSKSKLVFDIIKKPESHTKPRSKSEVKKYSTGEKDVRKLKQLLIMNKNQSDSFNKVVCLYSFYIQAGWRNAVASSRRNALRITQ
jgi:hypothetical protein